MVVEHALLERDTQLTHLKWNNRYFFIGLDFEENTQNVTYWLLVRW